LPAGDRSDAGPGRLDLDTVDVADPGDEEVLVEPVLVGWEGNCYHAVQRRPTDVARARGEARIVIGNGGVVRVLRPPRRSHHEVLREGELCMVQPNYRPDVFGYGMIGAAFGYDARGTVGLLARRTTIRAECLMPLPAGTTHSVEQWAAFSIRYVTAFANWRVAHGVWRLQVTEDDQAHPFVWGWGGGTTFAELTLAARQGARATIITSRQNRITFAQAQGLAVADRRKFPDIALDQDRVREPGYLPRYRLSEKAFLGAVHEATDGRGASVFVDYLGGTLLPATIKALAREGVVTTAGWRDGTRSGFVRALACINRHQHIHTHYARRSEVHDAMVHGERTGWMPPPEAIGTPWPYEKVPELVSAYADDAIDPYYPLIRVNP
jgi:NADPH:quinone reductase-like Zn-dependent oxidoreductase